MTERKPCPQPCRDCPFRSDIVPYQSQKDMVVNQIYVEDDEKTLTCHYTFFRRYGTDEKTPAPEEKWRHCAGAIIFARNIGKPKPYDKGWVFRLAETVYTTLEEFQRRSWTNLNRIHNWRRNQPKC